MKPLVLGTRGSDLALTQTRMVAAALRDAHPTLPVETRVIKTIGDKRPDLKLTEFSSEQILDKGIFTKELELALAAGEIDAAVHSLKDVPTEIDATFALPAVLPREDIRDVLLTETAYTALTDLPQGACLATSSVRRQAQLQWHRPDVKIREIRGNVPTRMHKLLADSELDGILLAVAGIKRLGYWETDAPALPWEGTDIFVLPLGPPTFLPACGQGAVALETRADDNATISTLQAINHAETMTRVQAERAILAHLQAGCHTPVGMATTLDGDQLAIHLRVFDEDQLDAPPRESHVRGAAADWRALIAPLMDQLK